LGVTIDFFKHNINAELIIELTVTDIYISVCLATFFNVMCERLKDVLLWYKLTFIVWSFSKAATGLIMFKMFYYSN